MTSPKKPIAENRTNVLRIRLTAAERKAIDQAAQDKTLETSTWARMMLLQLAKQKA